MRQTLYVIDDFYENPDEVREQALKMHYFKAGHGNYPGVRTDPVSEYDSEIIKNYIQDNILKEKITYWPRDANTAFQFTTETDKSWIHHDATTWAAVCYLTPDAEKETGTAIFRNKETGIHWWNPDDEATEFNYSKGLGNPMKNELWETITEVSNVYNRMVIYRGNMYHSSMKAGFGTCVKTGRLFQTFFFNTAGGLK